MFIKVCLLLLKYTDIYRWAVVHLNQNQSQKINKVQPILQPNLNQILIHIQILNNNHKQNNHNHHHHNHHHNNIINPKINL
jgi:hypothetical protein